MSRTDEELADLYRTKAGELELISPGRETGEERFAKLSRAEQDAELGPETAELVRTGKVKLSELVARDPLGRLEQSDVADI